MSETGLNAGMYEQLRALAGRFDLALAKMLSKDRLAADRARKDLANLLREIGSRDTGKPGPRLVVTLLGHELSFWKVIGPVLA